MHFGTGRFNRVDEAVILDHADMHPRIPLALLAFCGAGGCD